MCIRDSLYSTTLIPGEEVRIYEFDRYRRTRSETQRLSVHASFRQTVSALSQNRRSSSTSSYANSLLETRSASDSSLSVGGGLAGFFGAPSGSIDRSSAAETRFATGATASAVSYTHLARGVGVVPPHPTAREPAPVSYTHLDVYKRQPLLHHPDPR